jgi:hypothetical protein
LLRTLWKIRFVGFGRVVYMINSVLPKTLIIHVNYFLHKNSQKNLLLISCIRWSMNVLTMLNALTLTMARNTRELVIMLLFLFYMTTR